MTHPIRLSLVLCLLASSALAGVNARMLRTPAVSATQVAFVYAGDTWIVAKQGGVAQRISTPPGEEMFPRFSPDGTLLAFSGNYDGNIDAYVVPVQGGTARRLTQHPSADRVLGWSPDGKSVLITSDRESGKDRFNQFYLTPLVGGLPTKLPIPYGEFGAISPDGKTFAYTPQGQAFATWKRYRGGFAGNIWLFGLADKRSQHLGDGSANESQPMWHGRRLYFVSDRGDGLRSNIWSRDLDSGTLRQVTHFTDQDVRFPSIGPSDLVFEQGGRLWLLSLPDETLKEVVVEVITDRATLRPRVENVSERVGDVAVSPAGKRVAFAARGEVFTVPAEHGPILNLTRTSGVAERFPAWSPDGKSLAWFSDASGEYELWIAPADGSGAARKLTSLGAGFRYQPFWSPDSKKLVFIDQAGRIRLADASSGSTRVIDHGDYLAEGGLRSFAVAWSADSRWISYGKTVDTLRDAIFLYDTKGSTLRQVTSAHYSDWSPTFDPGGKYLYFLSSRTFEPIYGDAGADNTWIYANSANILAVPLRKDVASPVAPRSDVEGEGDKDDKDDDAGEDAKPAKGKKADKGNKVNNAKDAEEDDDDKSPEPVAIDLDGFEERAVLLPIEGGNFAELSAVAGKIIYRVLQPAGSDEDAPSPIKSWSLEDREEKTLLEDADGIQVAAGGEKALVHVEKGWAIIALEPEQEIEKTLAVDDMEMTLDPVAEWKQMFADAWRFERDFFYDPGMHGVDWEAMRRRYGALVDDCVTRWDLNFVIGELIGELSASHAYRWGGDTEHGPSRSAGLLGCEFEAKDGAFRISHIIRGARWDAELRSPLLGAGAEVKEGEWLLAVNGRPLDASSEPWAALEGLAGKTVDLTVGPKPSAEGSRHVLVETLTLEQDEQLRHLEWVERMRLHVERRTKGRVAYVYVSDTGQGGQSELYRQFMGQLDKQGLIVDERFNSGGQIPDRFIEMLNRPTMNYWAVRDGKDWRWPPGSIAGPKVMLVNGWSGSGGDCLPLFFRQKGLGPIIGTRTWGGLIGISGSPDLVDGGAVTVPTFRIYSSDGKWIVENHGVEPDIEVIDDPALMQDGADPQLDRAIDEVLAALKRDPPVDPPRPAYPRK